MNTKCIVLSLAAATLLASCGGMKNPVSSSKAPAPAPSSSVASSVFSSLPPSSSSSAPKSSSSSAISSSKSSAEPLLISEAFSAHGEKNFTVNVEYQGEPRRYAVRMEGMALQLKNAYPVEAISDYLYYNYYQFTEIEGKVRTSRLAIAEDGEEKFSLGGAEFSFYSKNGDFYLDLSEIDLSFLGINPGKYRFPDAYAPLKQANAYGALLDTIVPPRLSIEPLVQAIQSQPDLSSRATFEDAPGGRKDVRVNIDPTSLLGIAKTLGYDYGDEKFTEAVNALLTIDDDAVFGFSYAADTYEPTGLYFDCGFQPNFEPIVLNEDLTLFSIRFAYADMEILNERIPDFAIEEDLDSYQYF